MFGYYRFFLASLVLLSHIPLKLQGFDPGVAAVVSFYMLAGFVVSKLLAKLTRLPGNIYWVFYRDRLLRVFPLYLYVLMLNLIFLLVSSYNNPVFDELKLLSHFLIVPLNYSFDVDMSILTNPRALIIPPSWSLGVELQAYFLLPFVVFMFRIKIIFAMVSLLVYFLAGVGVIASEKFGYYYLPGVLFMFVLGGCIFKVAEPHDQDDIFDRFFPVFSYFFLVLFLIALGFYGKILNGYFLETSLGMIVGMPVIYYMAKSKRKLPLNQFVGDVSYGVFLSHWLVIRVIDYFSWMEVVDNRYAYIALVLVLSILVSLVGIILIEQAVKHYRYRFTGLSGGVALNVKASQ